MKITLTCETCHNVLFDVGSQTFWNMDNTTVDLKVKPCETCLSNAEEEGRDAAENRLTDE
jgi:hypothetical protein